MRDQIDLILLPQLNQRLLAAVLPAAWLALWQAAPHYLVTPLGHDAEESKSAILTGAFAQAPLAFPEIQGVTIYPSQAQLRDPPQGVVALTGVSGFSDTSDEKWLGSGEDDCLAPLFLHDFQAPERFRELKRYLGALELRWLLEEIRDGVNYFGTLTNHLKSEQ